MSKPSEYLINKFSTTGGLVTLIGGLILIGFSLGRFTCSITSDLNTLEKEKDNMMQIKSLVDENSALKNNILTLSSKLSRYEIEIELLNKKISEYEKK